MLLAMIKIDCTYFDFGDCWTSTPQISTNKKRKKFWKQTNLEIMPASTECWAMKKINFEMIIKVLLLSYPKRTDACTVVTMNATCIRNSHSLFSCTTWQFHRSSIFCCDLPLNRLVTISKVITFVLACKIVYHAHFTQCLRIYRLHRNKHGTHKHKRTHITNTSKQFA